MGYKHTKNKQTNKQTKKTAHKKKKNQTGGEIYPYRTMQNQT